MYRLFCLFALSINTSVCVADGNTDPTRPFGSGGSASSTVQGELKLRSIISVNGQARALINGQRLAVGDQLGEYRLLTIGKNYVVMAKQDERLKLSIFAQQVVIKDEK